MLLRLLREHGTCSTADLVLGSGLSATTVAVSVAHLSSLGLVQRLDDGKSSGGRPPRLLLFRGERGYVAAADIGGTRLRMMLADLRGTPVAQWATRLDQGQKTPHAIVSLIAAGLRHMLQQVGSRCRILHLTVGAPGITDVRNGVVLAAPNLEGWTNFAMRDLLERELKLPCAIDNDVNLAALGEHAAGCARGVHDFVFIAMGTGVGAGIVLRGALHHGSTWCAGEIGYLPVPGMPPEALRLQHMGQLERTIGGAGIEALWLQTLRRAHSSRNPELDELHAPQIFDLAEEGHPLAAEVTARTAEVLAGAIGTLALLYNPALVVLGGGVGSHHTLCKAAADFLKTNEVAAPDLQVSSLGPEAQLHGAVSISIAAVEADLLRCRTSL